MEIETVEKLKELTNQVKGLEGVNIYNLLILIIVEYNRPPQV